jgi:transcriptional regulator with XRE-family HTH domain
MDPRVVYARPALVGATPQPELGRRLREARAAARRSLAEVSEATEISPSFLSMVEKGGSDLSIGRLLRLTQYYGVDIADMLYGNDATAAEDEAEAEQRRRLVSETEGLDIQFLADPPRPLRPSIATMAPGGGNLEAVRNIGDAFVYLLEGELVVDVDDDPPLALRAGDHIYLERERLRRFRNESDAPARILSVVLRPTD